VSLLVKDLLALLQVPQPPRMIEAASAEKPPRRMEADAGDAVWSVALNVG